MFVSQTDCGLDKGPNARNAPPSYGSFLQTDPLGYEDSPNLYEYALNDPVNLLDPSGTTWVTTPLLHCAGFEWNCSIYGYHDVWIPDFGTSFERRGDNDPSCTYWRACRDSEPNPQPQGPNQCASHPVLGALGKLWALPNTVIGLGAAGVSYAAGKLAGTNPTFTTGNNSIQLLNSPLNIGGRAYTIGNVQVYASGRGPERVQRSYSGLIVNVGQHEEGHTVQSQILGPLYLPVIIMGGLRLGNANPLETGADKYARGTSCAGF